MLYAQVDHRYLRAVRVNGRVAFEHVLGCFDSVDDKGKVTKRVDRHYVGYAQTRMRYNVSDVQIKGRAGPRFYTREPTHHMFPMVCEMEWKGYFRGKAGDVDQAGSRDESCERCISIRRDKQVLQKELDSRLSPACFLRERFEGNIQSRSRTSTSW